MEPADVADQVREAVAEEKALGEAKERFRSRVAILIAIMAALLAITSLGGQNATKETINSNIQASDSFNFYQAKNIRQTATRLTIDELSALLATPGVSAEQRQAITRRIDELKATVDRYESEPDPQDPDNPLKGEGKKELLRRAQYWEERRNHAQEQDPNFDFSEALFQIAIVLGSVAIVSMSRAIVGLSIIVGAVATLLMINGFGLFVQLPFG
jgi:hypothetical protein